MDSLQQQLQQAQKAIVRGQLDYAGRALDKLRQTHTSSPKVWLLSAACYQAMADLPSALEALQQAATMGLAEPAIRTQVVDAFMSMKAWPQALKILQQMDPVGNLHAVSMARCEWGAGQYELAISRLRQFVAQNPRHAEANLSLWQCLERCGHFAESDQQRQRCQAWVGADALTTIMDNAFLVAENQLDLAATRLDICQSNLNTPHPGIDRAALLLNQLRNPDYQPQAAQSVTNNPAQVRNQRLDDAHRQSLSWLQQKPELTFFGSSARLLISGLEQTMQSFDSSDWYLAFGTSLDRALRMLATSKHSEDVHWHGFDSAEKITDDAAPDMPDNVSLHHGSFNQTLPALMQQNTQAKAAFIHIECDQYQPTQTVLETLHEHCGPNTVIQFDELIGYPGYREHEWKAWQEFLLQWPAGYTLLGCVFMGRAVAVQLK